MPNGALVAVPMVELVQGRNKKLEITQGGAASSMQAAVHGNGGGVRPTVANNAKASKIKSKRVGKHPSMGDFFGKADDRTAARNGALVGGVAGAGFARRGLTYGRAASNEVKASRQLPTGRRAKPLAHQQLHLGNASTFRRLAGRNAVGLGALTAVGAAGAVGGNKALNRRRAREQVGKASPVLSDRDLKHRKRLAAGLAVGTSSLGLAALGTKGASGVLTRVGRAQRNAPKLKRARQLSGAANTLSISAGGLGAVGGFNMASVQRNEARKRPVSKKYRQDYSAERNRHERNEKQSTFLRVGSGAALGGSAAAGADVARRGVQRRRITGDPNFARLQTGTKASVIRDPNNPKHTLNVSLPEFRDLSASELKQKKLTKIKPLATRQLKSGGTAAGLAALGVGGLVAADRLRSYKNRGGASYQPRYKRQT